MTEEERLNKIVNMARQEWSDDVNVVIPIGLDPYEMISEGVDNGAWVKAWVWVDFAGTVIDKESVS